MCRAGAGAAAAWHQQFPGRGEAFGTAAVSSEYLQWEWKQRLWCRAGETQRWSGLGPPQQGQQWGTTLASLETHSLKAVLYLWFKFKEIECCPS